MTSQDSFFEKITAAQITRVSVRSLCFRGECVLVQRPSDDDTANFAFPGGRLEYGESLSERVRAEYQEEMGVSIEPPQFLFVVENRFWHRDKIYHGVEHYFLVQPPLTSIVSQEPHIVFHWLPLAELADADLRPTVVRDSICDGSWRTARLLSVPFNETHSPRSV
ncbi:NUDIX domain-containing protein [Labrenzia sp. DG1229]|uniref:NUDIX hydrolase n=1 Tax=Labrenzia sp. DG1229 TaxID=681847 RepID=UPI000A0382D3|nr:NUDIX domain-containing protein [Labrenzia sp. DG1229]